MNKDNKYYVDNRVGCVAVRERVDGHISSGLHADLPDVIAYWNGYSIPEKERPLGSCACPWAVEPWKIEKAEALCALLNGEEETNDE